MKWVWPVFKQHRHSYLLWYAGPHRYYFACKRCSSWLNVSRDDFWKETV